LGESPIESAPLINAVTQYGADNTGTNDAGPAINAAINAASAGTVVFLPAGTYRINTQINIGQSRDNITLRGAGMTSTILDCRISQPVFVGSGSDYTWNWPPGGQTVTQGLTKESTVLTMADTSWCSPGQIIRISFQDQQDNAAIQAGAPPVFKVDGGAFNRSQRVKIVSKTPTSLTIFPPLYFTLQTGLSAKVNVAQFQTDNTGIEDLTIDCGGFSGAFAGIWLEQTNNCWVKNVQVREFGNYGIFWNDSLNGETRHCEIIGPGGTSSNGAGILNNANSALLIEDNIIREQFPILEVNFGTNGCVFAYNVCENSNVYFAVDTNHAPHNMFNLYEGNVMVNLIADGYFGSVSDDSIFRNWIHGSNFAGTGTTYSMTLKRFTRNYSVVGNVVGRNGVAGSFFSYGQPNIGNGDSTGTAQPTKGDFWADWKMSGTVTTKESASVATITLSSIGQIKNGHTGFTAKWAGGQRLNNQVIAISGNVVTLGIWSGVTAGNDWPAVGTPVTVFLGSAGYQELDLDVQASTIDKGNYMYGPNGAPGSMSSLAGDILRESYFRTGKPAYFGNLAWPPFNPASPDAASYDDIPAGYRLIHGIDPGASPSPTPPPTPTPTPTPTPEPILTPTPVREPSVSPSPTATPAPTPGKWWKKRPRPTPTPTPPPVPALTPTSTPVPTPRPPHLHPIS
jgi:hypothetical protein